MDSARFNLGGTVGTIVIRNRGDGTRLHSQTHPHGKQQHRNSICGHKLTLLLRVSRHRYSINNTDELTFRADITRFNWPNPCTDRRFANKKVAPTDRPFSFGGDGYYRTSFVSF
jgi:hypothetical protein